MDNLAQLLTGSVLLVDDQDLVIEPNARLLRRYGSPCFTAATYEDALRLLRFNLKISLLILDWHMPGGPPTRFVESVKRDRPDVTIIGNSGSNHGSDFARLGIHHFLQKPWTIDQLIKVLSQHTALV